MGESNNKSQEKTSKQSADIPGRDNNNFSENNADIKPKSVTINIEETSNQNKHLSKDLVMGESNTNDSQEKPSKQSADIPGSDTKNFSENNADIKPKSITINIEETSNQNKHLSKEDLVMGESNTNDTQEKPAKQSADIPGRENKNLSENNADIKPKSVTINIEETSGHNNGKPVLSETNRTDSSIQIFSVGKPMYPSPYGLSYWTNSANPNEGRNPEHVSYPSRAENRLRYDPTRNAFVLKVFCILFVMLISTAGIITLMYATPVIRGFFLSKTGFIISMVCILLMAVLSICVACCEFIRKPPWCYFLLVSVVLLMSIGVGGLVCMYKATTVIIAFAATAAVVMVCIALACTKFDFTRFILYVIVAVFALAICGMAYGIFVMVSGQHIKELHVAILFVQTLVSSIMFIIELQMVLGGKTVELTTDEWAFGAFILYTSVMDLFIKILITTGTLTEGR